MAFGPKVNEVSKTTSVLGGYLVFAGLISYWFKENLYIPDAVPSTIAGVIFGPLCANVVNPWEWFGDDEHALLNFTLHLSRIIIGVQVFFNGANLPKKYIKTEWLSLFMVLFPIMTFGWLLIGLLIWGLIPNLSFLESLVIAACIVPTDPVLANSICKGRFAETFVPLGVRALLIGESGANDGLALPYLMLSIYLVRRSDPANEWSSLGAAIGHWMYEVIIYQVIMGAVLGVLIGIGVRKALRFAHDKHLIDHESFLAYGVSTALFILGVVHMTGASDFIACFLAGCMINWDGWYQEECAGQAFSEIVDSYLATAIFLYIGALLPFDYWHADTNIVDGWRLFVLGVLVLLLRRLPFVIPLTRAMPCLDGWKEAAFVGYFGPIGVGTLYWTSEALEYLPETPNREHLREVILPINYFLIVFSVLIHGTSISLFQATRTAVGKGHPEPKDDDPIPIRPGADIYIASSHLQSRNDLSLSRTSTRRQSAREYLSRHISIPSAGPARPAAYRSQLDLALERSNTRRTSAKDYLDRTQTISPDTYEAALRRQDSDSLDDPKADNRNRTRAMSSPTPARRRSSASLEPVASDPPAHLRANSGGSSSGNGNSNGNNRASRLDWIRRGRLARGERVSDDDDDGDDNDDEDDSASNRRTTNTRDASDRV